jgi:hypothetical protein
MGRVINFVGKTKDKGLQMKVSGEKPWEIERYSKSDFAGDKNGRKSVTGMVILLSGVPISWKSKSTDFQGQKLNTLLCVIVVREVKFITHVLISMNIEFKKPINVYVDNIGAIFLTENRNSGEKTKHFDVKYHYIETIMVSLPNQPPVIILIMQIQL